MIDQKTAVTDTPTRDRVALGEAARRHLPWVYATAVRRMRDAAAADDVVQAVFLLMVQKGRRLAGHPDLSGWLFRTLGYCVSEAKKSAGRRTRRERAVAQMKREASKTTAAESSWEEIGPEVDAAVAQLGSADRRVILLHFYEQRTMLDVSKALGLSEPAARKRVQRALERVRQTLRGKGVEVSGAGLAAVWVTDGVAGAVPQALASKVMGAIAGGKAAAATGGAAAVAKGAAWSMTLASLKVAATVALGVAVAGGVGIEVAKHSAEVRQDPPSAIPTPTATRVIGFTPETEDQIAPIEFDAAFPMPEVQRIIPNDLGDLLVSSIVPQQKKNFWSSIPGLGGSSSRAPEGLRWHGEATDSWGNLYVEEGHDGITAAGRVERQLYRPVQPFRKGTGPQRLLLRYVTWSTDNRGLSHDRALGQREIGVLPTTVKGFPGSWPGANVAKNGLAERTNEAWNAYYARMPLSALRIVEKAMALKPDDMGLLLKQRLLLESLGDNATAEITEKKMVEIAMQQPADERMNGDVLMRYAQRMALAGNTGEFDRVERRFQEEVERIESSGTPGDKANLATSPMTVLLEAKAGLDRLKKAEQQPTIARAMASRDGHATILLNLPHSGMKGMFGDHAWFSNIQVADGWSVTGTAEKGDQVKVFLKGSGPRVRIQLSPVVVQRERTAREFRMCYDVDGKIPPPEFEQAKDLHQAARTWLDPQAATRPVDPLAQKWDQAYALQEAGKIDEALSVWADMAQESLDAAKAIHTPLDRMSRYQQWGHAQAARVRLLTQQHRYDQALELESQMERALDWSPFLSATRRELRDQRLGLRADIARQMVKDGQLAAARNLIEAARPSRKDLRDVEGLHVVVDLLDGVKGYVPRDREQQWQQPWDAAEYWLEKAEGKR